MNKCTDVVKEGLEEYQVGVNYQNDDCLLLPASDPVTANPIYVMATTASVGPTTKWPRNEFFGMMAMP